MMIIGWALCGILLGITLLFGRARNYGGALLLQIVFCLGPPFFLMMVSVPLFWLTIALAVLTIVAMSVNLEPAKFKRWAVRLTLAVLLLTFGFAWNAFQDTIERRDRLAFESLEQRLKPLETAPVEELTSTRASDLSNETLKRLEAQEDDFADDLRWGERRAGAIQRLHENTVQQFINSPGFGVTRMGGVGTTPPGTE
ncbi:MAG: hypothetical protein KDA86_19920 [Planctomycetaceae bacterium]|nr:hypothetical protein [Planctomycetaceae bacterium]